ncbi:unnamed protein product [Allacma fusca]|uniref:Uncharacterized protein n=1 Tax=Allacma fusca TaxID=39272 RepID=A0A8J2JZ16_9HEXA|nr:unnamed protein product [Allacma fusca]
MVCINPTKIERQNLDILAQLKLPALEIIQIFSRFQSDLDENMRVISTDASTGTPSFPAYMSREELASLRRDISETQLTGVYINFDKNEGCDEYNLGFHLLQSQKSITTLHVNFRENSQVSESGIQAIIQNNASTLTCIDLIANKRLVALVNINEYLLTLRGCSQLKILRLVNFKTTNLPTFIPPTLRELLLWGELKAVELLPKIRTEFQDLERLDFFDMDGSQVGNDYLNRKFRELLLMPKLKAIHWYKKNFDLSFISGLNGVKKQPFVITSAWSWPLKKSHLEGAMFISKG